jgi:hypothetical protein
MQLRGALRMKRKPSTAKRRKQILGLLLKTMNRGDGPLQNNAVAVTDATTLLELTSTGDANRHGATLHACMLMSPRELTMQRLRDLSETQTLLVLGTDRIPCAAALTRWRHNTCFLDYICSVVKQCGRLLFHNLMYLAHARDVTQLTLNSIPELTGMYAQWGCGCVLTVEDAQTFTFSVGTYVGQLQLPRQQARMLCI